jgi:diadenosine tetraphosphate (Ap4A) HIT family hydrolase
MESEFAVSFLDGFPITQGHLLVIQKRLVAATLPCDVSATVQIAKWVYHQIEKANGQVWVMEVECTA